MPKLIVGNEHVSKMDRVLALGTVKGDGKGKRERGNRTLLLDRILSRALAGNVKDLAKKYADPTDSD